MRVTGGEFRGRRLKVPYTGTVRPTQDAVREAVFNMLMNVVADSSFIDLFAGSGAVGFEALSRGAKDVVWVERDPRVARILKENIAQLIGDDSRGRVVTEDVFAWLARPALRPGTVDLVFADPPYEREDSPDRIDDVMALVRKSGWLAPGAIVVVEQRATAPKPLGEGWELIRERRYGRTRVCLFRIAEVDA